MVHRTETETSEQPSEMAKTNPDSSGSKPPGRWPDRIRELARQLVTTTNNNSYEDSRGELWCLLNTAVAEFCQYHGTRFPMVSDQDIEDIAAKKALDVLDRIVLGKWDVTERSSGEIASFVSKTARNELLNLTRTLKRRVLPKEDSRPEWDVTQPAREQTDLNNHAPDVVLEQKEYAWALLSCVKKLKPRTRFIWFLRVFCDMPSKMIAKHPEIRLKAAHIDVLLQRGRDAISECMRRQGYPPRQTPPGALAVFWDLYKREGADRPEDHDE